MTINNHKSAFISPDFQYFWTMLLLTLFVKWDRTSVAHELIFVILSAAYMDDFQFVRIAQMPRKMLNSIQF